ncbi:MAG: EAL domain-containing protein [Gammaproteobacteria bacterium]|nr:EAL domain-containing protein [Gammaproteobacteria bacterium]
MDSTIKGIFNPTPLSVNLHTTLHDCIKLMRNQQISSLIITENQRPVGIYTEADIVRTFNSQLDFHNTTIRELMSAPLVTATENINAFDASTLLTTNRIRHLVITTEGGELCGILTQTDIIAHFSKEHAINMGTVDSVMTKRMLTVSPLCSVHEVVDLMSCFTSGCAIAIEDEKPVGILTERDMASLIIRQVGIKHLTMADVMTSPVTTIRKDMGTIDAISIMNQRKIRRLIIVDEKDQVSGVLIQEDIIRSLGGSYIDLLKEALSEQDDTLHQAQLASQTSKTQLENLLQSPLGLAIIATDKHFNISYLNKGAEQTFGLQQANHSHRRVTELLKCDAFNEQNLDKTKQLINSKGFYTFTHQIRADDTLQHLETRITPIIESQQMIGYTFISRNITEQLSTERNLRLAAHVFEAAIEGILVTDAQGIIQSVNPAFSRITGYRADEVIGKESRLLQTKQQTKAFYEAMRHELLTVGFWQGEIWSRRKNGEIFPERLSISSIRDSHHNITQYTAVFYDITEIKKQQDKLSYHAYHDPLTELPNRQLFKDRLGQAITRARRHDAQLTVMFIDLDYFKRLNDTFGHQAGDECLQEISMLFRGELREGDTVSRYAGDEFTILLNDGINKKAAMGVAEKLLNLFKSPFMIHGQEAYLGASIGLACYPEDGTTPDALIKNADTAMYHAKRSGRNRIEPFQAEMATKLKQRASLESELRKALGNHELTIRYQPIIDLHSRAITSMEALLRWNNSANGHISPEQFIPIAEESGLIIPIGEWVLRQTCQQISQWQVDDISGLAVSVNLSARQFREKELLSTIERILNETGLKPQQLNLEITESSMMHDMDNSVATLECLKKLGVRIFLDDFGTGYSSLTCLQRFPIDVLKLDHSFVRNIGVDNNTTRLASAIIAMAKDLSLEVIAEGVENPTQLQFLKEHGCDKVQGYLFHKPLTEEALKRVLMRQQKQ